MVPHPGVPLREEDKERNLIWCASFQLAWDALKSNVAKGPVVVGFRGAEVAAREEEVRLLNETRFPDGALDPASYIALAGLVKDGVEASFREAGERKFGRTLRTIRSILPPPDGVLALAYLRKNLPFAIPFDPMFSPMTFQGGSKKVLAFGMVPESRNPKKEEILAQVTVLAAVRPSKHAQRPSAFALSFAVEGGKDELILAHVEAVGTLEARWKSCLALVAGGQPRKLEEGDVLKVPKMNFSLTHRFPEFVGGAASWPGFQGPIIETKQVIDFRLDEGGAKVESFGLVAVGCFPMTFILDGPFLLALREKDKAPYLLAWIANDELLAEAAK